MKAIRVGVIGLGHLGRQHLRVYSELKEARLMGGYDIDLVKARERCRTLGTRAFPECEALLERVEAVSIAVPTLSHYEVARLVFDRGVHLLIEKPITRTLEEAEALIDDANRKNLVLQVGHIERFNGAMRALKDFSIKPLFIESHRLAPFDPRGTDVSVVLDLMIHDVDIVLSLVKSPIERVDAVGVGVVSEKEDIANGRILFKNGCVANLTASRIARKRMRKMRIFQHNAYITLDFLEGQAEMFRLVGPDLAGRETQQLSPDFGQIELGTKGNRILCERPLVQKEEPLKLELQSFLRAVQTGRRPVVSGEDGRDALKVGLQIVEGVKVHSARLRANF
ncbi:MAG: Gfo/Idh/MocA family oxidoreductase [bacterium]